MPSLEKSSFDRHPSVGYELLSKIPNLQEVAEIVARQQDLEVDTGYQGSDEMANLVRIGSRILKLVLDYFSRTGFIKETVQVLVPEII